MKTGVPKLGLGIESKAFALLLFPLMVTQEQVVEALRTVKDPETEMNVVELFLVNDVQIEEEGKRVIIDMGFQRKNPDCQACVTLAWYIQGKIIKKIEQVVGRLPGVESVNVLSN